MVNKNDSRSESSPRALFCKYVSRKALVILLLALVACLGYLYFQASLLGQKNSFIGAQMDRFSEGSRIISFNGATFVRYEEPQITVTVYTQENCATCEETYLDVLSQLQSFVPTLSDVTVMSVDSSNTDQLAQLGISYVPSFVFDAGITETDFYKNGLDFFNKKNSVGEDVYVFYPHALGVTPQAYISAPQKGMGISPVVELVAQTTTTATETKDEIQITGFLTVDCPLCKTAHSVLSAIEKKYATTVSVERIISSQNQAQEHDASSAVFCAAEQDKALPYLNTLFLRQSAWLAAQDKPAAFTTYATQNALTVDAFTTCMAKNSISSVAQKHDHLFDEFGITHVPTIFINDTPYTGVQTVAGMEVIIKEILTPAAAAVTTQVQ